MEVIMTKSTLKKRLFVSAALMAAFVLALGTAIAPVGAAVKVNSGMNSTNLEQLILLNAVADDGADTNDITELVILSSLFNDGVLNVSGSGDSAVLGDNALGTYILLKAVVDEDGLGDGDIFGGDSDLEDLILLQSLFNGDIDAAVSAGILGSSGNNDIAELIILSQVFDGSQGDSGLSDWIFLSQLFGDDTNSDEENNNNAENNNVNQ